MAFGTSVDQFNYNYFVWIIYYFIFAGRDIIGLAETGSGKTGAFAIPILQALLKTSQRFFALVLTPTRELAFQIAEQFDALGATIGIRTGIILTLSFLIFFFFLTCNYFCFVLLIAVIVGGIDMTIQSSMIAKKPHVIIGELYIYFLTVWLLSLYMIISKICKSNTALIDTRQ